MPLLILFSLLVVVPLVEIYILIAVGSNIGALSTIALCLLTAAIGAALLQRQGLNTMQRARDNLDRGKLPAMELLEGIALAVGGFLLLTPGFVTDAIGFACLIPFSRRLLVVVLLKRVRVVHGPIHGQARPGPAEDSSGRRTIEGEFERRDDNDPR